MNDIFSQLFENVNLINEDAYAVPSTAPTDAPQGPTKEEQLIMALRNSIQLEQSAADTYERYANETEDLNAKLIFQSVADEEKVHIGEFKAVLDKYSPQSQFEEEGKQEAESLMTHSGEDEKNITAQVTKDELPEVDADEEPDIAWTDDNVPDIEEEDEETPEPDMDEEDLPEEEEEEVTAEDEEPEEEDEEEKKEEE